MMRVRLVLIWVVVGMLLLTRGVMAQPMGSRVPHDAIVYVGWAGTEALQGDYEKSNLKGLLEACTLSDFVHDKLPGILADKLAEDDDDARAQINEGLAIFATVWKHQAALYVGPLDWSDPKNPRPRVALLCQAGPDTATLLGQCQKLLEGAGDAEVPVQVEAAGNGVLITIGLFDPLELAVLRSLPDAADKTATLPGRAEFAGLLPGAKEKSALCMYVDVPALLKQVDTALANVPAPTPDDQQQIKMAGNKIIDALGVRSLKQGIFTAGFEGKVWSEQGFLGISGPRTGLVALMDAKPLPEDFFNLVPQNACTMSATQFDFAALLGGARTAVAKIDPELAARFEEMLAEADTAANFDLDKDLIATLGNKWLLYQTPATDDLPASATFVHPLRDEARFTKTLRILESMIMEQGAPVQTATLDDTKYSYLKGPNFAVAWTVANGNFIVTQQATLAAAIKQSKEQKPSILANEDFQEMRRKLGPGAEHAATFDYADLPRMYPELAKEAVGVVALANVVGVDIPPSVIPDAEKATPFLASGGAVSWVDESGVHMNGIAAFPGAEVISGGQGTTMVAAAAMGTAIVLPSLGRARELANRSVDGANLTGVAKAAITWANEHGDKWPDHPAQLVAAGVIAPKMLVRKGSGTKPAELTEEQMEAAKKDWHAIEKVIDEHCDYLYFGKGMSNDTNAAIIMGMTKPSLSVSRDGVNCLFGDGHVEWTRSAGLRAALEQSNVESKARDRPLIDIDVALGTNKDDKDKTDK